MQEWYDKDLPESVRNGQRLTTMTAGQTRFPIAPSKFRFSQVGSNGLWMNTEMLPWTSKVADDLCLIRSMHTEAINHEPAICAMQTGNQVSGHFCAIVVQWLLAGRTLRCVLPQRRGPHSLHQQPAGYSRHASPLAARWLASLE
jgi:hypothetical protein